MATYLIGVVEVQQPTSRLIDLLVTVAVSHDECCIHMHIVACQVERNKQLKYQ